MITLQDEGNPPSPYYFIAKQRAIQRNLYDPAGRVTAVQNLWQHGVAPGTGGPVYSYLDAIPDGMVSYAYSATKGLRESQSFWTNNGSNWAGTAYRTENYTYDPDLDYLTDVNYGDGSGTRTWTYDPAGNRSSDSANSGTWTYDNLNRMTASPGHSYSNDILGNRTNRDYATQSSTAMRHDWDVLNRAINILGTSTGGSYAYRADGQRVEKVEGATLLWTPTGSRG